MALSVYIGEAHGLHHLNHFCADQPYCVVEVVHADTRAKHTTAQTRPVTMAAKEDAVVWNEQLTLEPWQRGEALQFTVYDKGLMGSKVEAKAMLPAEYIDPHGFEGELPFDGHGPEGKMSVQVQIAGPSGGDGGFAQQQQQHAPVQADYGTQPAYDQGQTDPGYGYADAPPAQPMAQEDYQGVPPYEMYHPSHDEYLAQLQSTLPPGHRIVGARYSHSTIAPTTHIGQAQEVGVSVGPIQTISHLPGVAQPVTSQPVPVVSQPVVVHPAHTIQGVPMTTTMAPMMPYGQAPMVSYGQAPPTMIAATTGA